MRPSRKYALPLLAGAALFLGGWAPSPVEIRPADPVSLAAGTVLDAVKRLKAGQYIWAPQIAPAGPLLMIINITTQRAVLYRNGVPIGITTVSTGRSGHLTPTGVFTVLQKQVRHYSSIYDNAPMPYMQRLTWGGVALHGGSLPGYPASHGCIRLPKELARLLYGETHLGMTVMIVRSDLLPAFAPSVDPLLPPTTGEAPASDFIWQPDRAPAGPLTIFLSAADGAVVVIRNGRQIGSAAVTIDTPVTRPMLFVLQSVDAGGPHWARMPLPGQEGAAATELPVKSIRMPEAFRSLVLSAVRPGTTVLVTADSLRSGRKPKEQKLLESE
ncbi:MAG: L,D-transpeptidase family protein [Sphingomonas sp.]|jgi:hypothetical protein|uniref:L,D-transpeptidase family protein n=1 Tax=Sphingomonas sp. TaxID=28214 RepID=UPI003561804C